MGDDANRLANNPQGGALADYQMQLMLLEQQNKRRLLMARQEQETIPQTGPPNAAGQPAMMSQPMPFNVGRQGQSPGPNDMTKRNPSQMTQSPRPDGIVGTRGSPAPPMFENAQPTIGNPQFFQQNQMRNGMGPNGILNGIQGPNGQMRPMSAMQAPRPGVPGGQFAPGMPPFGQTPQQQPMSNPNNPNGNQPTNQPANSMPPPQAPVHQNGKPPSPSAAGQVPGTPSQKKEAGPKSKKDSTKKETSKAKQTAKKAGPTPSTEAERELQTPTPSTPVDPHPPPNVLRENQPNGVAQQPPPVPNGVQAQSGTQQDVAGIMDPQHIAMNQLGDNAVSKDSSHLTE